MTTQLISRRRIVLIGLALPVLQSHAQTSTLLDEDWQDTARNRSVPVRIRWPSASPAAPAQGHPVVLYSHGLGGSRMGGAVWSEAWAAAGFVVLHMQHPGSDTAVFQNLGKIKPLQLAQQLVERLADVEFVLDELERRNKAAAGAWARVNLGQIGLAGHSFGAHTTLGMAGQHYPMGKTVNDKRLRSFIALSPKAPARNPVDGLKALTRPLLSITGSLDGDVIGDGTTVDQRVAVYDNLPAGAKAELFLHDADHMTFGGGTGARAAAMAGNSPQAAVLRGSPVARQLEPQHQALVASISTDWWRKTLLSDAAAAMRLQKPGGLGAADRWRTG